MAAVLDLAQIFSYSALAFDERSRFESASSSLSVGFGRHCASSCLSCSSSSLGYGYPALLVAGAAWPSRLDSDSYVMWLSCSLGSLLRSSVIAAIFEMDSFFYSSLAYLPLLALIALPLAGAGSGVGNCRSSLS